MILHVSFQQGSQVGQSHSMSPSAPRGGGSHRIGTAWVHRVAHYCLADRLHGAVWPVGTTQTGVDSNIGRAQPI